MQSQTDWNISDNCRSAKSIRDHPLTLLIAADEVICRNYSQPVMVRAGPKQLRRYVRSWSELT